MENDGDHAQDDSPGPRRVTKLLFYTLYVIILLGLVLGVTKLYDIYLVRRSGGGAGGAGIAEASSGPGGAMSLDLYPYTGFHVQPNVRAEGEETWAGQYSEVDVRTGDHGFFIDFDLENPPARLANEFRIIVIGGSAAQGWGARSNKEMFHALLEGNLNRALAERSVKVRVINLAMAGSVTYQNFIALNKWGHPLEPDLILSFAGHNDLIVTRKTDVPLYFGTCMGLVESTKHANGSPALRFCAECYPGIFCRTQLGTAIRVLDLERHTADAVGKYTRSHQGSPMYGANLYLHSLKSIKRDFDGIPMMVVLQPTLAGEAIPEYAALMDRASRELKGYRNDDWYVFDLHAYWQRKGLYQRQPPLLADQCHFSNEGHKVVAEVLADELTPVVQALLSRRGR